MQKRTSEIGLCEFFANQQMTPTCAGHAVQLPKIHIAFQAIVNVSSRSVIAYEALVRGQNGQGYPELVEGMSECCLRHFNRHAAAEAIRRAVKLGLPNMEASLCLNILPDLDPAALNANFIRDAAIFYGLSLDKIVLELTEDHRLSHSNLNQVLQNNKAAGFVSAVDDFGAGYAGLTAMVDCRPEVLKLDRALVRGIDTSEARQQIVGALVQICHALRMILIAEGVEHESESRMLRHLGIDIMQGFLFSRPIIERLPQARDCGILQPVESRKRSLHLQDPIPWHPGNFPSVVTNPSLMGLQARSA